MHLYTPRLSGILGRTLKDRVVNRHGLNSFQYLEDGEEVNEKTKRQGILSHRDPALVEWPWEGHLGSWAGHLGSWAVLFSLRLMLLLSLWWGSARCWWST